MYETRNQMEVKLRAEALSNYLFNPKNCLLCLAQYTFDNNLPRVLVQCGHSICTICSKELIVNNQIACPFCCAVLEKVANVSSLPVNQQIFVTLQKTKEDKKNAEKEKMKSQQFSEEELKKCELHKSKIKHFFCIKHEQQLCKSCISYHTQKTKCEIVDLLNIKK